MKLTAQHKQISHTNFTFEVMKNKSKIIEALELRKKINKKDSKEIDSFIEYLNSIMNMSYIQTIDYKKNMSNGIYKMYKLFKINEKSLFIKWL